VIKRKFVVVATGFGSTTYSAHLFETDALGNVSLWEFVPVPEEYVGETLLPQLNTTDLSRTRSLKRLVLYIPASSLIAIAEKPIEFTTPRVQDER
jgi:hypothetical protein